MRLILVGFLICCASLIAQGQGWKRSDKKDGIETSYQTDKIGSDRFVVNIKVHNNRSKTVKVLVRAKYSGARNVVRKPTSFPDPLLGQPSINPEQCALVVASGDSSVCSVTITTSKVTGTKIVRWDVENFNEKIVTPRVISVTPNTPKP